MKSVDSYEELLTDFDDSIRIFRTERLTRNGCGNKEFKLTENLLRIKSRGCRSVLTFGGRWSNHVHAFALACRQLDLQAVAAVRGEESGSNELLRHAVSNGLRVHVLSRDDYRLHREPEWAQRLCDELGCDKWLPEGGSNVTAVSSCRRIAELVNQCSVIKPTHIALAVGTGATMAGIVSGADAGQRICGVPVVQDKSIESQIDAWLESMPDPVVATRQMLNGASPARYGRVNDALLQFVVDVHHRTGVVLDPVYNGKALKAVVDSGLARENDAKGQRNHLVFIHTGGIGGCLGWVEKLYRYCSSSRVDQYLSDARKLSGLAPPDAYQSGNCPDN